MKKKIYFIVFFLLIDLTFSQFFLLDLLEKKIIKANKESFENRIYNQDYKYTFKKNVNFKSQYYGYIYEINTNDLGFRDSSNRTLDRKKLYSIVIGDSFVEGVGLDFQNTLVGSLNKKLGKKINQFEFLNAGVASYSSYIYKKKITKILNDNPDLKVKDIIVLLDKSDVIDDEYYLNKPSKFKNSKGKLINQRKEDFLKDLKDLSFWRFYTKQTVSGKIIKLLTDQLENTAANFKSRLVLAKKLNKKFYKINQNQIKSLKSINNRLFIRNWFEKELWEEKGKKNIKFSIENLKDLNDFLKSKNINLSVVLYPWSFEVADDQFRKRYLDFILPLLEKNRINTILAYDIFYEGDPHENIGKFYIYNDIHFNENGYKILANYIYKNLNL